MTQRKKIVVTSGDLPSSFPVARFAESIDFVTTHTDEQLGNAVRQADILYTWQVPADIPERTPRLRWIQLVSAGVDHVRELPVWNSGITITAAQGLHTVPMSEHFIGLLLALTRQIPSLVRAQDRMEWAHRQQGLRFDELRGKTLGIVGWGKIGDGMAHLARAFGMRVVGTRWTEGAPRELAQIESEYADPPWLEAVNLPPDVVYQADRLHEVLGQSDVVVLMLPLTSRTRSSFGRAEFEAMKPNSLFLNLGRGQVVDEEALVAALRAGTPGAAALDVVAHEPLEHDRPLWSMPNVLISPHVGGMSNNTRSRVAEFFAVNLTRYLEGQPLLNQVQREAGY